MTTTPAQAWEIQKAEIAEVIRMIQESCRSNAGAKRGIKSQ